jgi:hypothetical protein
MINKKTSWRFCLLLPVVILSSCFVIRASVPLPKKPDIIFVRIPAAAEPSTPPISTQLPSDRCVDGCQIVRFSFSGTRGKVVLLTAEFLSARDPAVSFSGEKILFAGKQKEGEPWQIWQMDVNGENKIQITHGNSDCVSPLYVGSLFHLDDKTPTRRIAYLQSNHLYTCDLDGKNPQRITFNLYPEFSPDVLPNGRIIFSSLKNNGFETGSGKSLDLLAVNIDGTDLMGYLTGFDVPGNKEMVRIARDGRVYFIQTDVSQWLGGGTLAHVSSRRPAHSYHVVDSDEKGFYHSPCPLPDGSIVVSYRGRKKGALYGLFILDSGTVGQDGAPSPGNDETNQKFLRGPGCTYSAVLRNAHGGDSSFEASYAVLALQMPPHAVGFFQKAPPGRRRHRKTLYVSDDYHCVDARVLAPHPVVKGRSSFVDHNRETGIFYCIDVYISDRPEVKRLARGSIEQVRVLEGGRTLGTAPVEADGSFHIRVPAKTPLAFQLLDKEGKVITSQHSWTWVMPRESRGCIGCHEDRELAPPNQLPRAVVKPAVQIGAAAKKSKKR